MNDQMRTISTFAAVLFACAASANASLIPALSTETASGSNFAFNYSASVTSDERLDTTATDGVTCPGPGNTLVQCNPAGTFFTIYDIPGFVSASTSAAGWTVSTQDLGITPSSIDAGTFDSPMLMNVTFMYAGPVVPGPDTLTGFQIVSSDGGQNLDGHFTSQATKNTGADSGVTAQLVSSLVIPMATVPEPGSFILWATGLLLTMAGLYRRKRT